MYGKKRIGITREGVAFVAGKWPDSQGGSYRNVGRIAPSVRSLDGAGYDVHFYNWRFIGTAETKTKAKILMYNAAKNHKDWIGDADVFINEKGQLYRA